METILREQKTAPTLSPHWMKKPESGKGTLVLICHNLLKKSDYIDLSLIEQELSAEMFQEVEVRVYPHLCQNLEDIEEVLKIRKSSTLILSPCFGESLRKNRGKMAIPRCCFDLNTLGIVNLKPAWKKKKEGHPLTHSILQILRRILHRMAETGIPRN